MRFPLLARVGLVAALTAVLGACHEPTFCPASGSTAPALPPSPAILVEVRDSVTTLPAAQGATGAVRDGVYIDSLQIASDLEMAAAIGRSGTYDVTVRKASYRDWERAGVRVQRLGECDVATVRLEARLQPVP